MIWDDNFLKIASLAFLYTGSEFAFFHPEASVPLSRQDLKISSKSGNTESLHNFSVSIMIMSCPWTLLGSRFFKNFSNIASCNWS